MISGKIINGNKPAAKNKTIPKIVYSLLRSIIPDTININPKKPKIAGIT